MKQPEYNTTAYPSKGVYVAVLNQGNIRAELSFVLTEMTHQQKYRMYITYPSHKPIAQNRNKIIEDFLKRPEFDYLLMIDSDIVPPPSILDMLDHLQTDGVDIITPLMYAFMDGAIVPLVLDEYDDKEKEFHKFPYYVKELEGTEGLVEVAATGSGCMGIKREVLEALKDDQPFCNIYDKQGIKKLGLDLSFCRKAKDKGFRSYVHLDYNSSHWVTLDLKMLYKSVSKKYEVERKDVREGGEKEIIAKH